MKYMKINWNALLTYVNFSQRNPQGHMRSTFIYISGGNKQLIYVERWSSLPIYLKMFVATRCSTRSFVGSQFISLNSLAPIWCLELSFKQKQIHLFWVTCIFFLIFLLTKGHQETQAKSKCGWIKKLHKNLRNFESRNLFCLYKNRNFSVIFLRDLITMHSPLKLAFR